MYRSALRHSGWRAAARTQSRTNRPSQWVRHASGSPAKSGGGYGKMIGLTSAFVASAGAAWYFYGNNNQDELSEKKKKAVAEKPAPVPKGPVPAELMDGPAANLQVERSWENPGVYAWGSNSGKVVAPGSDEQIIKTPTRIPYFDGKILRDLKLDKNFGVAVTEEGDIVQWGAAYSPTTTTPTPTLRGKDVAKVALSSDRIIALSRSGAVYSLPVAQADQLAGAKATAKSGISLWTPSSDSINYRELTPPKLGWGEKVVDIKSGLDHCLMLTSHGRVFSAASSTANYPSKGQLGIPGLTWLTRPKGPFDQPHEVKGLPPAGVSQIAAGNYHSLALDKNSNLHAWGDNSSGQLGFEVNPQSPTIDTPKAVPLTRLLTSGGVQRSEITSIAAGGSNSFFTTSSIPANGRPTAEAWSCGAGLQGELGNGKWIHMSTAPAKMKALSGMAEYDDRTQQMVPIGIRALSVGTTHAAAVMDNLTSVAAAPGSGRNWGSDVMWWGGNEFYQLGTGKRRNVSEPLRIAPLDNSRTGNPAAADGQRFQLAPAKTTRIGEGGRGRKVGLEQRIECGRNVTAVYSASTASL
ncbi:hypothetical protein MCOR16_006789 [Pyricularia oryzae]|nr:hypothetical protein MCOR15_009168 [Pyricularia oryzae]KAI6524707.1 hypothetical protein MCOR16_006789 [Pyricularia oryzae]